MRFSSALGFVAIFVSVCGFLVGFFSGWDAIQSPLLLGAGLGYSILAFTLAAFNAEVTIK